MALTTSDPDLEPWPGRRVDFAEEAGRLAARRAELGNPKVARNAGARRTASKRALLEAIERAGGDW